MTQVSSLGRKQEQYSRWSAKGIGRNGTFQSELREIFHAWLSWVDGVVAVGEADERSNKAWGNSTFETQGYERGSHDYLGFVGGLLSIAAAGSRGEEGALGWVLYCCRWRLGSDRDVVQIWSGSEMAYQQAATFAIFIDVDGRNNDKGRGRWSGRREECCGVGTDAAAVLNDGNWRRTNRCVGGGQHFKTILVNVSVQEGPPPPAPRRGIGACCVSE